MSEGMSFALELMGIGMVTVFIILLLVVWLGNAIVLFVNRYVPAVEVVKKASAPATVMSNAKTAAIVAAVKAATDGKGDVISITKK